MNVVLAPDSFKECLSAMQVCEAMAAGVRAVRPLATVVLMPMADGGEGSLDVVLRSRSGQRMPARVCGPMGLPVEASFGLLEDGTAFVEGATANGLALVPVAARHPLVATSRGVGELLLAAIDAGARRIILTLGGSATVDGGTGLARALGYEFLDAQGDALPEGGGALADLCTIVPPANNPLQHVDIQVACDVDNPLTGAEGAARVFAPQKGASPADVEHLEAGLRRLGDVLSSSGHPGILSLSGGGAAGGLGAGLVAFAGGRLTPGVDLIAELIGLLGAVSKAELVISGEGHTDGQTLRGKVIAGVARMARQSKTPCVTISGGVTASIEELAPLGLAGAFSICNRPMALADAMRDAVPLITQTTAHVCSLFVAAR